MPTEFSASAGRALESVLALARLNGARLHMRHVVVDADDLGQRKREAERQLQHLQAAFRPADFALTEAVRDDEAAALAALRYAEEKDIKETVEKKLMDELIQTPGPTVPADFHLSKGEAALKIPNLAEQLEPDLIVLRSHGRSGMQRILLGSTAEKVLRRVAVPVFVVKSFGKSLLPDTPPPEKSADRDNRPSKSWSAVAFLPPMPNID